MNRIKLVIIDVDGTMTDGGFYYDSNGNEIKKFNTRDAAGFFAFHAAGIKTMILTGRESEAVRRRTTELKVDYVVQNVKKKNEYLRDFLQNLSINAEEVAYIGDEMNDYRAMQCCGLIACPSDAADEIKEIADYISPVAGGAGVVRDVAKYILNFDDQWKSMLMKAYE